MQKNEFLRQFFEIAAGSKLEHTAEQYNYINFDVNFSFKDGIPIAIFSGEHLVFQSLLRYRRKIISC